MISPLDLLIKVEELTSCNNAMYFPQYDKYIDLSKGDVIAEINLMDKIYHLLVGWA